MSVASKAKLAKDFLGQFKSAFGLNNAQVGSMLIQPSSLRTKAIATAIGTPLKSYLEAHAKGKAKAMISKISVPKLGNAVMYLDVANAGTQMLRNILPTVAKGADWTMALPFNVLNQTLGRIPGFGSFFRAVHNFITEGVSKIADIFGLDSLAETGRTLVLDDPDKGFETNINWQKNKDNKGDEVSMPKQNKTKIMNAPSFYENLDLHKSFSIPGAYTKTTVVNGTLATPKIAVHRLAENPVPDVSALVDRLNQKFSLIKAVRGLSATQYSVIDLANYERLAKITLLQYYVIKKVVQAAKTYSVVQSDIGNNVIDSLGFDPAEVRANLANYETLLCQIHRYISNNLPMSGTWIKRLEYLVQANVPDYSDKKIATVHMFSICMGSVFTAPKDKEDRHELVFDCIPGSNGNSYNVLMTNFNTIQSAVINSVKWQQLIADYFGAFGAAAMWSDKDYPAYSTPLNLANADNDLCREQIKNGFYLNNKLELITIDAGVPNHKFILDMDNMEARQLANYQFGVTPYTGQDAIQLEYDNILNDTAYLYAQAGDKAEPGLGSSNVFLVPDTNGVGAQAVTLTDAVPSHLDMTSHETIYTLHKDSYSEGEALEISQFKSRTIGMALFASNAGNNFTAEAVYKTQEYGMINSVVYVYGSNGSLIVPQTYTICNEAISDDDLQSTESAVDYPDEIMCWCLIDWMPFTHFTFFGFNTNNTTYYPRDVLAIDMDSFGSLDDRAFATSVNYSVYSLQGASLVVSRDTKRISNLGDVYKDKPSRKG